MRRLDRYLFFSTTFVALIGVGVIVSLMVGGNAVLDLFDLVEEGRISPEALWQLIGLLIPYMVSFAMPAATVVGVLVLMGRISSTSELTAMKACGISLWRVSVPILAFCLLASALTAWINASAAPAARASYRELIPNAIRAEPLRLIVPRQFVHDFPGYIVYVDEENGQVIRDIWIWELDDEKRAIRLLRADTGDLRYNIDDDALILRLEKGVIELRDEKNPNELGKIQPSLFFDNMQIRLSLAEAFGREQKRMKTKHLSHYRKIDRLKQLDRRADRADGDERREIHAEKIKVLYNIHESFASAVSAFSLGLLAIPLGIKANRRETSINVVIAAGMTVGYYVLSEIIRGVDDYPQLRPDLLVWVPNLGIIALSVMLIFKADRY